MATALKGVNASASGLVVAAALILGQSYATSLPEQVLAMLCFSGITFFGVHQALTVLPNPDPNPNPNPDPNSNPNPNPNPNPCIRSDRSYGQRDARVVEGSGEVGHRTPTTPCSRVTDLDS